MFIGFPVHKGSELKVISTRHITELNPTSGSVTRTINLKPWSVFNDKRVLKCR